MIIRQDFYYLQGYFGDFRYFCKSNIRDNGGGTVLAVISSLYITYSFAEYLKVENWHFSK